MQTLQFRSIEINGMNPFSDHLALLNLHSLYNLSYSHLHLKLNLHGLRLSLGGSEELNLPQSEEEITHLLKVLLVNVIGQHR